jgi:hypothetical protein
MWPTEIVILFIVCRIFLSSLTLCNTSFFTWKSDILPRIYYECMRNVLMSHSVRFRIMMQNKWPSGPFPKTPNSFHLSRNFPPAWKPHFHSSQCSAIRLYPWFVARIQRQNQMHITEEENTFLRVSNIIFGIVIVQFWQSPRSDQCDKKVVPANARTGYLSSATDAVTVRRGPHIPGVGNSN